MWLPNALGFVIMHVSSHSLQGRWTGTKSLAFGRSWSFAASHLFCVATAGVCPHTGAATAVLGNGNVGQGGVPPHGAAGEPKG